MSNSVTVTVQLDGGSSAIRSFDLGDSAPPPPDGGTGDDGAMSADAAPPDVEGADAGSIGDDLPPPDVGDEDPITAQEPRASHENGDNPPPPDV
ncbi:MAG: hypothetical protein AAF999_10100 [Pseudomonadota bacterium]